MNISRPECINFNSLLLIVFVLSFTFSLCGNHPGTCYTDEFNCYSDEECLPMDFVCDGSQDCDDGSDEHLCFSKKCPVGYFHCLKDRKCINETFVCDGDSDCSDFSDEQFFRCQKRLCRKDQWLCSKEEKCIDRKYVCDGTVDCFKSQNDELHCSEHRCMPYEFRCGNGNCISSYDVCDGIAHCPDGSDEHHCFYQCLNKHEFMVEDYGYFCENSTLCLEMEQVCDGKVNCNVSDDDDSDETNCTLNRLEKFHCPPNQRRCYNTPICVALSGWCNGVADCDDSSDEENCDDFACGGHKFTCISDKTCVDGSLHCDGKPDCVDGSDESGCEMDLRSCRSAQIYCPVDKRCIDESKLCNGVQDCHDGSDEPDNCNINECGVNKGGCEHDCEDLVIGYRCLCPKGLVVAEDNHTCVDRNECLEFGVCDQICENTHKSYACHCFEGYHKNNSRCQSNDSDPLLLVTNLTEIFEMKLRMKRKQNAIYIAPPTAHLIAIEVAVAENFVYFSDLTTRSIQRKPVRGKGKVEVIVKNVASAEGLAYDWLSNYLYWTENIYNRIEAVRADGSFRTVILDEGLEHPRSIVLEPHSGKMYWTDWGARPHIAVASMTGEDMNIIVSKDLVWPNGLALDHDKHLLYFVDGDQSIIHVVDINGENRRSIIASDSLFGLLFRITIFEDYIFWVDRQFHKLHSCQKFFCEDREVHLSNDMLYTPMDLKVFDGSLQRPGLAAIPLYGSCDQLCLRSSLSSENGQLYCKCTCGVGYRMLSNNRTCEKTSNDFIIMIEDFVGSSFFFVSLLILLALTILLCLISYYLFLRYKARSKLRFENAVYIGNKPSFNVPDDNIEHIHVPMNNIKTYSPLSTISSMQSNSSEHELGFLQIKPKRSKFDSASLGCRDAIRPLSDDKHTASAHQLSYLHTPSFHSHQSHSDEVTISDV